MPRLTFRPRVEGLEDRFAPAVIHVTNTNNAGSGSLHAAIATANTTPGADTIDFAIAASGVQKINFTSALPAITETVTIDGTTQSGFVSTPVIVLNGALAGAGANGLVVVGASADNCIIRGLVIQQFAGNGIVLYSNANQVDTCFIGTNAAGTASSGNGGSGIALFATASDNIIGGTGPERNLISGNGIHGVALRGSGVTGNRISGNYIGSNLSGTQALSNQFDGVAVSQGASTNAIGEAMIGNFIAGNNRYGIYIGGIGTSGNNVSNNTIGSNRAAGVYVVGGAMNNTIGGTTPGLGNIVSANGSHGVAITGAGTSGNAVQGNFIGTEANGNVALGNRYDGVLISAGASGNTVGGTVAAALNLISGNGRFGVNITGVGTSGNTVSANLIGIDVTATTALANAANGVQIAGGAFGNTIGGTTPEELNVISGNGRHGILITGAAANTVIGNHIGTNGFGTSAVGNKYDGIVISGGSTGNRIGTADMDAGNIISGNGRNGVLLSGLGTTANALNANTIGLNAAGNSGLGNGANGIQISGRADGNLIGGSANGPGNTISRNVQSGILINGANNTIVQQNKIGTGSDGTGALGNSAHGVFVTGGAANNLIGFLVTDILTNGANTIANNAGVGVLIGSDPATGLSAPAGTGNAILGNSIFANGSLGIDLGANDGRTVNDATDSDGGPNRLQNFPTVTSAIINGMTIEIEIALTSTPNSVFRIEVFASQTADLSGFGEGTTFLGWIDVVTNATGQATGSGTFDYAGTEGIKITATATNLAYNDTSEFSFAANAM